MKSSRRCRRRSRHLLEPARDDSRRCGNETNEAARHLDRGVSEAGIDDVGGIGTSAEWLLALPKSQWPALAMAIADAIRFRRDRPCVLEEGLRRLVRQT